MRNHVVIVAWLHIVLSGLAVLGGLVVMLFFGGLGAAVGAAGGRDALPAIPLLGGLGAIVFTVIAVYALPGLIGGWGLLQGLGWARIVIIVVSILELVGFPFYTALGVYGLVVMFNPEVVAYFNRPSYMSQ